MNYRRLRANLEKLHLHLESDLYYPDSANEAESIQNGLIEDFKTKSINFKPNTANFLRSLLPGNVANARKRILVCGTDVSYATIILQEENGTEIRAELGVGAAVVYDALNKKEIETQFAVGFVNFPYTPGLLAFREIPLIISAFKKIKIPKNEIGLIFYDGHGIAHDKKFGAACQLGMELSKPAIGVAKKLFFGKCNDSTNDLKRKRGNYALIKQTSFGNKKKRGKGAAAMRSALESSLEPSLEPSLAPSLGFALVLEDGMKPVYVSPGFPNLLEIDNNGIKDGVNINDELFGILAKICLESSPKSGHVRIPEPIFLADRYSRQILSKLLL